MRRVRLGLAIAVAAVVAAASSVVPVRGAGTPFVGPPGWTEKDQLTQTGLAWAFYPPNSGGTGPHIDVRAQPVPASLQLSDLVQLSRQTASQMADGARLKADHSEKICYGKARGWFFAWSLTANGTAVDEEQVIGMVPKMGFIATYGRPKGAPENAAARKSLDSLCPQ